MTMGYFRRRDGWRVSQRFNSTGSNWGEWFGKDLSWKGSETNGELVGTPKAFVHVSYRTNIGAMVYFRGEKILIGTTERYGNTTSKHESELYSLFGYSKISISASPEELDDLEKILQKKYGNFSWPGVKPVLPTWIKQRVDRELKRRALASGEVNGWTYEIRYTEFGKIKKLCAFIEVKHPSLTFPRSVYMRKGEFMDLSVELPVAVRAVISMKVHQYHEFTTQKAA